MTSLPLIRTSIRDSPSPEKRTRTRSPSWFSMSAVAPETGETAPSDNDDPLQLTVIEPYSEL